MWIYWDTTSEEKEEMWLRRGWSMRFIKSRKKQFGKKFGEFVANKVWDLNSSRLQSIVQHKIHTILLEAEMELHNVQIHNEQTQLTVYFDSKHSSASYTVPSTSTPQSSSSSVSDFQITATKSSSANGISEFIALKMKHVDVCNMYVSNNIVLCIIHFHTLMCIC